MKPKYRGHLVFSLEEMHSILNLPEEVELIDLSYDTTRERVYFKVRSDKSIKHTTFETGESMEIAKVRTENHRKEQI